MDDKYLAVNDRKAPWTHRAHVLDLGRRWRANPLEHVEAADGAAHLVGVLCRVDLHPLPDALLVEVVAAPRRRELFAVAERLEADRALLLLLLLLLTALDGALP